MEEQPKQKTKEEKEHEFAQAQLDLLREQVKAEKEKAFGRVEHFDLSCGYAQATNNWTDATLNPVERFTAGKFLANLDTIEKKDIN